MFCTHCGTQNTDDSRFCVNCGNKLLAEAGATVPLQEESHSRSAYREHSTQAAKPASGKMAVNKTPLLAAGLSFLFTGLGQFYNGDTKKGAIMIGSALLLLFIFPFIVLPIWIFSMVDAYQVAEGKKPLWI